MKPPEPRRFARTMPRTDAGPLAGLRQLARRGDQLVVGLAERPWQSLLGFLVLNLVLAAFFLGGGAALGDRAALFREGTPGTFLSFAELLLIAAAARAVHVREASGARWWQGFFGLSAAIFLLFAVDEITQSATFIGGWLHENAGLRPAQGFHDLEAVLLTLLFAASALVLLPRALALKAHLRALPPFAIAVALGVYSQALDSFAQLTLWEFVVEESLKLSAEAFLLGGFLVALHDTLRRAG